MYRQLVTGNRVGIKECLPSKIEDSEAQESGPEENETKYFKDCD